LSSAVIYIDEFIHNIFFRVQWEKERYHFSSLHVSKWWRLQYFLESTCSWNMGLVGDECLVRHYISGLHFSKAS